MWPTHYLPNQPRLEGLPAPRYVLTTPPYPLEQIENIEANGTCIDVNFGIAAEDSAEITASGTPVSGVIKTVLVTCDGGRDELTALGITISGILRTVLVSFDAGRDELTAIGTVVSGNLRDPLVTYDNWPLGFETEDLTANGTVVSGVLT